MTDRPPANPLAHQMLAAYVYTRVDGYTFIPHLILMVSNYTKVSYYHQILSPANRPPVSASNNHPASMGAWGVGGHQFIDTFVFKKSQTRLSFPKVGSDHGKSITDSKR